MRIAICDDEKRICTILAEKVGKFCLNITGRRSRLSGGGGATCPDFRSHPVS